MSKETELKVRQALNNSEVFDVGQGKCMPNTGRVDYILDKMHSLKLRVVPIKDTDETNPIILETSIDEIFNRDNVKKKLNDVRKVDVNGSDLKVTYSLTHDQIVKLVKSIVG